MLPDDLDPILLARYFNGEGTEVDVQAVRQWIAADPARAVFIDRMREVWRIGGEVQPDWDVDGALAAVRARGAPPVDKVIPLASRSSPAPARTLELLRVAPRRWRVVAWRIAAAVTIAVGVGFAWRARMSAAPTRTPAVAMRTFATAAAEQATITLSDGSQIVLGPASTLRVPERLGAGARHVSFEGEAYFAVARDTLRPFTVAVGNGLVRVLGTKFDVRSRPENPGVTVVVSEGRVSLARRDAGGEAAAGSVVLAAGDLGQLPPNGLPRSVHGVDVRRYLGWTEGRLTFVDTPVPVVLAELTRWYDVEFRLGDPELAQRHLTTSFRHETVAQVLDVLTSSLDVRGVRDGRTITLYQSRR